jgi:hypothetical protein
MARYFRWPEITHAGGPDVELSLPQTGLQPGRDAFLHTLPEVDTKRIGITGASGGGTQSFLLAAVDERVAASFPAVMVSTSMQGGCVCENTAYLRVGTTNIELSALIAPRPLGMTGANVGREIERRGAGTSAITRGGARQRDGKYQLPHNYNQPSREVIFFFNGIQTRRNFNRREAVHADRTQAAGVQRTIDSTGKV